MRSIENQLANRFVYINVFEVCIMLIFVDIDETICSKSMDGDYSTASPWPEKIAKVNAYFDQGHTIVYWTARGTKTGINWFNITHQQLRDWGCKFHELRIDKPAYDIMFCDKTQNSLV